MNGQVRRQELVREVLQLFRFEAIVETGSHRGTTTDFLRRVSDLPVHTVEIDPRLFHYARLRFKHDPEVVVRRGHSVQFLQQLAGDPAFPKRGVFFYLDAHPMDPFGEMPTADELRVIAENWEHWLALVDDVVMPHDPGYEFEVIGGRPFDLSAIPLQTIGPVSLFWPAAPSSQETGRRRGCVIVASGGDVVAAVERARSVYPVEPSVPSLPEAERSPDGQ